MKFFKIFLCSISIFFILTKPFCSKAAETDIISKWLREDMEILVIERLENIAIRREKERLIAAKPKIKKTYHKAAELVKTERYDEAKEEYGKILAINPKADKAQEYITKINKVQGIIREKQMKTAAIQKERDDRGAFKELIHEATELYRQKKYEEATAKWEAALKYEPDNEVLKAWIKRSRVRGVKKADEDARFEKGLEEEQALSAVDAAYVPKRRKKAEEEKVTKKVKEIEKKIAEIEKMLETIKIEELHLRDADLRHVINKITSMTKVTILVDWTAISEATGISVAAAPVEGGEAAAPAGTAEVKTMHLDLDIYNPMPLKAFLDYLMTITRLKYQVKEHAVLISTPKALEDVPMEVKIYKLKYGMTKLRPVNLKPLSPED